MNAIDVARRHRYLTALAAAALLLASAVPIAAYIVVPALVRTTLVEDAPRSGDLPAAGTAAGTDPSGPDTLLKGELVRISLADYGSGTVRIVNAGTERFVRFENVDIAAAPDMYVYLSDRSDGKPGSFVDLGKLKATNGSFNYPIPATVDLTAVHTVVIWCRQFSVTVTFAVMT